MARLNSFYLASEDWDTPFILQGSEAKHLGKVLRTRVGDTVRLFDGCGREGLFTVTDITKSKVQLEITEEKSISDLRNITLAIGWNKSSRRNWILEKSVELQTRGLIFFQSEFSQGKVPAEIKDSWHEKLVAAAKQCGNPWLPELQTVSGSIEKLIEASAPYANKLFLYEKADEDTVPDNSIFAAESTLAVIGPEGGFSPREAELLIENNFIPLSLGNSILRWETAALLCMGSAYLERQKT
ncbi:16S rRNA (uracil(1498)-N(3))-methyltransferase [Desulfovibrio sp. JC010]|uniref:16S rRNA (uracil(1498)-N(3))-methyltransferase n=1 Tax=Desulfovibrio sp. JC010 TaxID=2593641 RepID=UPI0013CF5F84|nr:16S rRNA (uracil(1498)-N(3))-methyltransferase [Desulfovibrio sp. JC010]NDV27965.1 16S rRNA (uracil(1498)-N(3))-methyltransferase [Desulfovibrio sp. JC010]